MRQHGLGGMLQRMCLSLQADHGPSGHGNSVQGNPQGDMSGNVQGGTMETNLCGYAAPEVDYNHGYGGNMGGNIDYSLTETIEAPAQPFTGDYSYAQPWQNHIEPDLGYRTHV